MSDQNAQALAEAVAAKLVERDAACRLLGIHLSEIRPGYARLTMPVRADMMAGVGIGHGGITFTLADAAFAFACNSRNTRTVAQACNISFTTPTHVGDTLTAVAEELLLKGRTGLYDITITNQNAEIVAFFRGNSYSTRQVLFPELV